jgi:hypothetical protein
MTPIRNSAYYFGCSAALRIDARRLVQREPVAKRGEKRAWQVEVLRQAAEVYDELGREAEAAR